MISTRTKCMTAAAFALLAATAVIWAVLALATQSPVQELEPYGGCDEAWQAPHSEGADWCRQHGYIE